MDKVSAVVIAYNEEQNIKQCLQSVKWADEVILVDSFSTDKTVDIAKSMGVRVIQNAFEGYGAQKNYAFEQASHPWIINIDADEVVTEELQREIQQLVKTEKNKEGYFIYRRNFVFGKEIRYSGWNHDKVLRFIRKDKCKYPDRLIHSEINIENPGLLKGKILHYTYHSFDDYITKLHRYIIGSSQDYYNEGKRAYFYNLICNPIIRFMRMYILQRGFLDGISGFILAVLASYYVFLKYAELYRLQNALSK